MPVRGFDHLAITVQDVQRTAAFYADVLGAEVMLLNEFLNGNMPIATLVLGENRINVHPSPPRAPIHLVAQSPTPGSVDLCVRWDGPIDEVIARLSDRGLPVIEGPVARVSADGRSAVSVYTRDPDGNLLEFLTSD